MPGRKEEEVVISVGWYARIRPALAPMCGAPSYRDITVGSLLTNLAQALPARPALLYEDGPRYTFAELETEARLVARGLIARGVERGERVVVWATNVPEWIVLQFALAKIGAILVTANTALRASDIEYLARQSEAATLVTISGFRGVDYISALDEIGATRGAIPGLRRLFFIRRGDEAVPPGFTPYDQLRTDASAIGEDTLDARDAAIGIDDVINMQYTSGTTGFPKGVMLSSRNIVNNGEVPVAAWHTRQRIGCVCAYRSFIVSAASSACSVRIPMAPASVRSNGSIPVGCWPRLNANGARPSTACRRCFWRSSSIRSSRDSISHRSEPG